MKVVDLIKPAEKPVPPFSPVEELKPRLLEGEFLTVMESDRFFGILTLPDIVRTPKILAVDCIHPSGCISPDDTVRKALDIMVREKKPALPVFNNEKFLGLVYRDDVLDYLKRTEEVLEETEKRYKFLYKSIPDCVWVLTPTETDGGLRVLDVNDVVVRKLGYTKEELKQLDPLALIESGGEDFTRNLRFDGDYQEIREVQVKSRGGDPLVFEVSLNGTTYGDQPILLAIGRDITRRKAAELRLLQSETELRSIIEQSSDGILLIDSAGRIIEWNEAMQRITGLERDKAVGRAVWELEYRFLADEEKKGSELEAIRTRILSLAEGERGELLDIFHEEEIRDASGNRKILQIIYSRIVAGGTVLLSGIFRDITEKQRMQEEIRESRERLRLALDSANKSVFDWDIISDEVRYTLPLFGFKQNGKGVFGMDDLKAQMPVFEDRTRFESALAEHLAGGTEYFDQEHRLRTWNDDERWFHSEGRIVLRDSEGSPLRMVGILTDIDDRKQAEEALRKAIEQAETANLGKSLFIAGLGHEIRNLVTGIISAADIMMEPLSEEERSEYAELLKNSAQNLITLINNSLDMSKIEADRLELEEKDFNLTELIKSVVLLFSTGIRDRNLKILHRISPDVPEHLRGDPTRLTQVLANLVGNAVKFTDEGTIQVCAFLEKETDRSATVRFSVKDTGVGIPVEKQKTIFLPYTQADAGTTRKYGGTGLGLAIVKKLVTLFGGKISLDSEPGAGSTFRFTAEFRKQRILTGPSVFSDKTVAQQARVLVVDDDPVSLKLHGKRIGGSFEEVIIAENGKEMEKLLAGGLEPDIILMDVHLKDDDGIELARSLRERYGEGMIIIAVTGDEGPEIREQCLDAGMDGFITKPLIIPDLLNLIGSLPAGGLSTV